ncbi:MAG TPA: hypothetical protein VEJ63_14655 [Planctomycetota bacterium]|nr:hypothetical protein [Planctomycetota bacterium]
MRFALIAFVVMSAPCFAQSFGEEDEFTFDPRKRRDPFTFTQLEQVTRPNPGPVIQEKLQHVLHKAEQAFMEGRYGEAASLSRSALAGAATQLTQDSSEVCARLMRLETAAVRMEGRASAEREFKRAGVRVSGVVVRDGKTLAIVNSRIVARGELLPLGSDDAIVEEVHADHIVLSFRGYRMTATLSRD